MAIQATATAAGACPLVGESRTRERRAGHVNISPSELASSPPPPSPRGRNRTSPRLARSSSGTPPRMPGHPEPRLPLLLLLLVAACGGFGLAAEGGGGANSAAASCDFSVERRGELYSFALAAPTPAHRHGVLSEDGFYKVAVNDSILWFQLCDEMIFNFDAPMCLNCQDCGGPLRCGTGCSALVSKNIGGYDVCTTIGRASNSQISLIDESKPLKGVIVKMFSSKCSISIFVLCDSTIVQAPHQFVWSGDCDYATTLTHPSGCGRSGSAPGNGWGWLGSLFITILCLLGGYFSIGAFYRYYFLGIYSIEAIPNLEFWSSLPQRLKSIFVRSTRRVVYSRDGRDPYAHVSS